MKVEQSASRLSKLSKSDKKVFKKLQDLGKVKDRFIIPEDKLDIKKPEQESFKQEIERAVLRDEKSIELMNIATKHVRVYDSKETAVELMNRAYKQCTSMYNRRMIASASFSLKEAIKAEKWMNSKKRKRHVDQNSITKNLNNFYDKLNDAVLSIKIEIEKRTNKLFNRVKSEYTSDLPIELPESKTYILKKANIVAQCLKKPSCKHIRLESNLFLLESVDVVGVNLRKTNSSVNKAQDVAGKNGWSIHDQILSRPSKNIHWYLVLNFNTSINYASFADALHIPDSMEGNYQSYEELVRVKEAEKKLKEQLKTKRLYEYRKKFEEDNLPLYEDIKQLKIELANLLEERSQLAEMLSGLTTLSENADGLSVTNISKLDDFTRTFRDTKHYGEGIPYTESVILSVNQKIEAKAVYYELKDVTNKISVVRSKIKFLESDKTKRRRNYALELGLIGLNTIVDVDA